MLEPSTRRLDRLGGACQAIEKSSWNLDVVRGIDRDTASLTIVAVGFGGRNLCLDGNMKVASAMNGCETAWAKK
jgi:hypothetical protein